MKVAAKVLDVEGTLDGERVRMGLDPDATAHLMSVLTDLYEDPEAAVVREYSTNAFDAHVEAGVTRPIEVTLPTPFSPFFRVRDFGNGLDAEDIRRIYSQYGASTKRNSNDVVGMLGLGCKSALTYTDQFTLSSVKDGICTQVSISRDEDGGGSMTIVSQEETTEPTGTEVIVPVASYHSFKETCANLYRFWSKGTVLVNGEEPKKIDGIWLTDDIVMSEQFDTSYIVMGNVAYPYDDGLYGYNTRHTAAYVKIGEVEFTPSREQLRMTKQTKATLETVKTTVERETQASFAREVENAATAWDAVRTYEKVRHLGFKGDGVWNGETIPADFRSADNTKPYRFRTLSNSRYRGKGSQITVIPLGSLLKARFFVNYPDTEFSPYKQKKIAQWQSDNQVPYTELWVGVESLPADLAKWVNPDHVHDWNVVNATKLPANGPRQDGRPSGSYNIIDATYDAAHKSLKLGHQSGVEAGDLDTSKPLYWIEKRQQEYRSYNGLLAEVHPQEGYTLVILSSNRINKFKRDFPGAKSVVEEVENLVAKWEDTITDEDKTWIAIHNDYYARRSFENLDADRIDDPELVAVIKLAAKSDKALMSAYNSFSSHINGWDGKFENPLDKYPLANDTYRVYNELEKDHLYLYLNAAYAAAKGAQ